MYKNKRILAIIPARGGSKGLKRKNVLEVCGKPLIAWTISAAKKSRYLDRLVLTSEDSEIISVARTWGCDVPFIRPKSLAGDKVPGVAPVIHAVKKLREQYDYVVVLQPTSPLRTAADIDACVEKCISGGYSSCVSVTEPERSPFWMYKISKTGVLLPLIKSAGTYKRRQDLPPVYALNGAVYVVSAAQLLREKKMVSNRTAAYFMPKDRSLDIDTSWDLRILEASRSVLKRGGLK